MMNLLEVQDDLKNFSQDQLVKEMQQPSGAAPQFLVLSELNRRKRVKGDFEARQAKQQPTVAEEAVAAAGVPQQGMMGMSEAMAPASVDSGGIGAMMPKTMKMGGEVDSYADGGIIRAQDGLPKNPYRPFDEFPEYPEGYEYTPEDTRLERIAKGTSQVLHDVKPYLPFSPEFMKVIGNDLSQFFNEPVGLAEQEKEESEDAENMDQALNDAVIQQKQKDPAPQPKLNLTSKDSPLSIEQELLKRQADLSKSKDFDKYMALAQAGLSIMGSTKPTLAGAIGEGGTAGLKAFNEARKRYDEGLTDILNARAKLQQAKITAAGKGRLTRSGALTAISSYNNAITAIRKEIADIYQKNPAADQDAAVMSQINDLKNQIIGLETEKSQLYNTAQIRPRSSILVKDLPSSQKES